MYIYRRDGSTWVQQQKIIPGDARRGDGFGTSLSMDPNWLAVGSPNDDITVSNQGSVYLYRRNGNSFSFDSKVTVTDPRVSQAFGFSVAVAGTDLLVGAPGDRTGAGAAYRFERDGSGEWRQRVKFQSEIENSRSAFGRAVGIGAQDLVMGATGEVQTQLQARSGAVYSLGGGGILRQGFQNIEANFGTLNNPDLRFADIDGDGDLDLTIYGVSGGGIPKIQLYTNEGADTFKKSKSTFAAPRNGSVGWIDIDNNGSMDFVVAGDFSGVLRTDIYFNNGNGAFTRVNLGIPGFARPALAWADFDSDGDQDLLIGGADENGESTVVLLRHQPGISFELVESGLPRLENAAFEWGDYDKDSDPDILISGLEAGVPVALVFENRAGSFRRKDFGLPNLAGEVKWVDFTADGYLDVFLCGKTGDGDVRAILLKNESKTAFTDLGASLPALEFCSSSWGDYDNDGDNDLVLSGTEFGTRITDVYENVGEEGFDESRFKLSRVSKGAVEWVDFDRDGRLDLAVAGRSDDGLVVEVYRNSIGFTQNQVPDVPRTLRAEFNGSTVVLKWGAAKDDQTATPALTYNLRVGSSPGGIDILAPNTTRNGYRMLSTRGNVGHARRFTLSGLTDGIYYWSVQAVDNAFAGSEFAPEGSFIVGQSAQDFQDINAAITGVAGGASQWVDFRRSGFLDILLTGRNDRGPFTRMYRYRAKSDDFVKTDIAFPQVAASAAAFGDYDNDADMDLALIGETGDGPIARIYRNDRAGRVTDISAPLVPVSDGAVAWGDLDNDGDIELVLTGFDGNSRVSLVYTNNRQDEFVVSPVSFVRLSHGSIDIGDFDGDSDNDVLLTGFDGTTPRSILYRNDGFPRFTRAKASFVGVRHGEGSFGDFDGDGDLDVLISGQGLDGPVTRVYENRGSENFVAMETPLPDLEYSSISWGDFDNNGKMDVLLSGSNGSSNIAAVYRYMGSKDGFQVLHIVDLPATQKGAVSAGDYDRDGRLDILVSGEGGFFPTSRVIQNQVAQWKNTPPSKPTGLSYRVEGNKLYLFWQASQDAETPSSSLSYDLRVSTKHSGADVMSPNTKPNGDRMSATRGNVGYNRRWTIVDPPPGRLTVSVHAVDGGYMSSQSSDKLTLEIGDDQSSFTTVETALPGVEYGQAAWVDFDEDGDIDINVTGGAIQQEISKQYLNNGNGEFSEVELAIPAVAHATTVWGDYDG
ncbi:MAG: FG-GAP-like repeat-containing protein, partial [Rhodothermia bacterium]